MKPLTARQEAEAIEQFGDDLAALSRAFDRLCARLSPHALERLNSMSGPVLDGSDMIDGIAEAYRALGAAMSRECDRAEEAEDRRRDNPLEPDFRRLGQ